MGICMRAYVFYFGSVYETEIVRFLGGHLYHGEGGGNSDFESEPNRPIAYSSERGSLAPG